MSNYTQEIINYIEKNINEIDNLIINKQKNLTCETKKISWEELLKHRNRKFTGKMYTELSTKVNLRDISPY